MALEDLFKVVKARFGDEQPQPAQQEKNVEIPEDLLFKCPRCGNVIYNEEFLRAMKVCPKCGYHSRLTWKERLDLTVDKGSFKPLDESLHSLNPIGFPKYEEKVEKLSQQVGMNDAIKTGECTIRGYRCVIGIMDSHFMIASNRKGTSRGDVYSIGRCENAGGHHLPHADGKDQRCGEASQRCRRLVYNRYDRSHDRRRYSFLCKSWRRYPCRA